MKRTVPLWSRRSCAMLLSLPGAICNGGWCLGCCLPDALLKQPLYFEVWKLQGAASNQCRIFNSGGAYAAASCFLKLGLKYKVAFKRLLYTLGEVIKPLLWLERFRSAAAPRGVALEGQCHFAQMYLWRVHSCPSTVPSNLRVCTRCGCLS